MKLASIAEVPPILCKETKSTNCIIINQQKQKKEMKQLFVISFLAAIAFTSCSQSEEAFAPPESLNKNYSPQNALIAEIEQETVSIAEAQSVATAFLRGNANKYSRTAPPAASAAIALNDESTNQPLLYVINFGNDNGFVIVSASKKTAPILAFSESGTFTPSEQSPAQIFLDKYKDDIRKARQDNSDSLRLKYAVQWAAYEHPRSIVATQQLTYDMQQRVDAEIKYRESQGYIHLGSILAAQYYLPEKNYKVLLQEMQRCSDPQYNYQETVHIFIKSYEYRHVDPLMVTDWHQGPPFNVNAKNGLAGCVPIAIAQIVYYHKFPSKYDWENIYSIPVANDAFVDFITDIRDLCKVSYNEGATSAKFENAESALKKLGYTISEGGVPTVSLLQKEVSNKRPVFIEGFQESGGGHAWVCDGWQERRYDAIATFIPNRNDPRFELTRTSSNGFAVYTTSLYPHGTVNADWSEDYFFFHMNLGWGKDDNAWYTYNTNFYKSNVKPFLNDQNTILISK